MASDGQQLLDLVCREAGEEAVAALLDGHGGSTVYIPAKMTADHWMAQLIGLEPAAAVITGLGLVGGITIAIPIAERSASERNRREIWRRLKLGQSANRIAREVGVSARTVHRHRARIKQLARRSSPSRGIGGGA